MMRNNFYAILFAIILWSTTAESFAQFTFSPTKTETIETLSDTISLINAGVIPVLNSKINSDAYRRFVRRETAKYRNKVNFQSSIGITQTALDNWAAGGDNAFSGRVWAKFTHTYTNEETNFNVASVFEGAYKLVATNDDINKSEDFFYISSTPSWKLAKNWEFSGSLVFKSQFSNGYVKDTVLTSALLSPAYLTLSAGITYAPTSGRFKAYIAPISLEGTFLANKALIETGGYGVAAGHSTKVNFGIFTRFEFNQPMFKETVKYSTKLETFWNYSSTPKAWWENRLTYQLNSIFGIALDVRLIYDETAKTPRMDTKDYLQIYESVAFNFTFNIASKKNEGPLKYVLY